MSCLATPFSSADGLTPDRLADLARTYDDARKAVWIHDASCEPVYSNAAACLTGTPEDGAARFEIFDHAGRVIGHLVTA